MLPALTAFVALTLAQAVEPGIDFSGVQEPLGGEPTQVLVLGTSHLNQLPEGALNPGDLDLVLERLADQVQSEMSRVKGITDLGIFRVLGQPNLNVRINREAAARYGLNTGDVNTVVQAALSGSQATTILEGDRQFALTVRLAPEYRATIDAVRNIRVAYSNANGGNAYIPLSALADITLDTGASYIYHEKNARYIPVKFSVRGRDLGGTVEEAQQRIAQHVKLPQGYRIDTSYGCEPHLSPSGRRFLWIRGGDQRARATPGSDAEVNLDGYISVTPMRADLTAHDALDRLKDAFA